MSKKGDTKGAASGDPTKAVDLLPPDGPAPTDPAQIMKSDASLMGEVETRKIGIRRVSGITFGNRFLGRARWRPAGNSRSFWRNIEADDPFLAQPTLTTDAVLEIYPTQRLARMEGSLPKPQPDVAKAYTPRPEASDAPPPAGQEVKRKPRAKSDAPEQRHTPEPRPARAPKTATDRREKDVTARRDKPVRLVPDAEPEVAPPVERRLPPKPQNTQRTRTGRQRMPSRAKAAPPPKAEPVQQKTAKEIREEKKRARSGPVEKSKSLDQYRDFMQSMNFMRDKFEAGEEIPEIIDETADKAVRRPKPKGAPDAEPREVKRKPKAAAPAPKPKPAANTSPGGLDRSPPRPKKREAKKEIDRSIKPGGNNAGLDDLFGGGGDRVRIPRRAKPTDPKPDDET